MIFSPTSPDLQVMGNEAAEHRALISPPDMERFLHLYDDALAAGEAKLAVFSLAGAATFASRDAGAIARRAATLARDQRDVCLHIHLHDLPEGVISHRGGIDSVRVAIGVFGDVDARGPGRKKPPETLCPTAADAIWVVEQFNVRYQPLRVSVLIASGYGCYPAILFREPLLIEKPEDGSLLETLGRRFHGALHKIASERGWTGAVDYCDLAKVLRLPGCVNWKDPASPKPVRLVHADPARFDPGDLDELLPHPEKRRDTCMVGSTKVDGAAGIKFTLDLAAKVPDILLSALIAGHPQFAPTWNHQRDDLQDKSCSAFDMAIAGMSVSRGLTDQQIADLIVVNRRRFQGPKQDRKGLAYQKYIQRTIAKARVGGPSSEEAERQWTQFPQQVETAGGNAPPPEASSDANPNGNESGPSSGASDEAQEKQGRDQQSAPGVHPPLEFLLAKVRTTGDVKFVYENITFVAALSDAEVAVAYQSLKTALGSKLNYRHFDRAIKDTRARQQWNQSEHKGVDPRPIIRTDDRLLDEIAVDAIGALEAANQPPVVFRRGGALVLIHPDEDGRPVIMRATEPMMRGRLARVARFLKNTRDGLKRVSPPEDLTRDILASNEGQFPPLGVLTQVPILRPDGTVQLEPGYDTATRAYYLPNQGFRLAPIPTTPTRADAQAAVLGLDEVIGQFPFASPADKANCIALLLTPILKVAFRMKAPLALIDAPKWGTGKTLLGMAVYVVATGSEGTVCAAPAAEEEWRKRMMSILERGSAVVIIDNVEKTLRSPALSAVLTTAYWEDRVLGRSEDVRLPNVATWIATGNNVVLGAEMARRAYRIKLDARISNPARRTGFKRTDQELLDWAASNRGVLAAALMTMIRAWWVAGQPRADVPAFGSFNKWAQTLGGILAHASVNGFLSNLDAVQTEADEESQQWDQFLRSLVIAFRDREFTTAEVVETTLHTHSLLSQAFPDDIGHPDERAAYPEGFSLQRRLGKALARKCGTRFGELELRIERGEIDKHSKVQRWRVAGELDSLMSTAE